MNPATILRLANAFDYRADDERYVLEIGARAGTWPATIYNATRLGYLERTRRAYFRPTERLWLEVERAAQIRRERNA